MRQGDTICLMLDYQINGQSLVEGAYDEIELQINKQGTNKAIKKLLSNGEITWETVTYNDGGTEQEFTGYVVRLTQNETFNLGAFLQCQLRIKMDDEVGSSGMTDVDLGDVLSTQVL